MAVNFSGDVAAPSQELVELGAASDLEREVPATNHEIIFRRRRQPGIQAKRLDSECGYLCAAGELSPILTYDICSPRNRHQVTNRDGSRGSSIGSMAWPRSNLMQSIIAMMLGLLAVVCVWLRLAMESFNNFYFGPHKAYPYPYPNAHSAHLAMYRNCAVAFALVSIAAFALERLFASRKPACRSSVRAR